MNRENIEQQASLYVLELLSEEERAAFELLLEDSNELKQLVRELRKGLFESVSTEDEPVRMDLLSGIHEKLALDWREDSLPVSEDKPARINWAYIWAAAAMIFLGLNLMLLLRSSNPDTLEMADSIQGSDAGGEGSAPQEESLETGDSVKLLAQIERLRNELSIKEEALKTHVETLASLESENEEIRSYNAGWQREYTRLAARFLPFFESRDGMSRFTVIEMVDELAYNQDSRHGFAELAGSFLIGDGNIASVGDIADVGPVAAGVGLETAREGSTMAGLSPSIRSETGALAGAAPDQGTIPGASTEATVPESSVLPENGDPTGFTVWRDDEQKGFLDIYNLPDTSSGESPFLWVRASELEPYIPVGFLPELENGTGSLFYEVDEANFTPTEILVTSEVEDAAGSAPSGNILLRGP